MNFVICSVGCALQERRKQIILGDSPRAYRPGVIKALPPQQHSLFIGVSCFCIVLLSNRQDASFM
jgi:hypothetical protein